MSDQIENVHALADGSLSQEEAAEVSSLVKENEGLAREYQWAVYLRSLVRAKCLPVDSSSAWKGAVARLDALDAVRGDSRVEGFVGKWSWAMAACLVVVILIAGVMNRGAVTQVSGQQMAGVLGSSGSAVGDSSEASRVLNETLGGGVSSLVQVRGVAKGTFDGHSFVRISARDASGGLDFVVIDEARGFEGFSSLEGRGEYVGGMLNGLNCVGWSAEGRAYLVCGERSTDALISLCDQVRFK